MSPPHRSHPDREARIWPGLIVYQVETLLCNRWERACREEPELGNFKRPTVRWEGEQFVIHHAPTPTIEKEIWSLINRAYEQESRKANCYKEGTDVFDYLASIQSTLSQKRNSRHG